VSDSRRRGGLLRRLLAAGDWIALIAALCIATTATSTTDVATLFWAVLFSPVWILVLKLHGLYDNDHRRIRHSTLDELPALVSASALGTLALDGLLTLSPTGPLSAWSAILVGLGALVGSFTLRAVLRFAWHRLTGVDSGVVVGSAAGARMVSRRVATHPEARLRLIGYLTPGDAEEGVDDRDDLPRLGSIGDISRVARDHDIERVVVTAQEMSEPTAERLIEQCKAAGLGLTLLPQHYGLLGPGIELNRCSTSASPTRPGRR
jgi:FlaA1/EpsC-like NDP-sugar epimerase